MRTSVVHLRAKLILRGETNGGLRPIAAGNTFRRLSTKCAGYHVFESRQARYGNRQVGVGIKRGAKLASCFPLFDRKHTAQKLCNETLHRAINFATNLKRPGQASF